MKIFSLPVILIAAVVVVGAGSLIYATSGYTDYRKPKAPVATSQSGAAPISADGTAVSSDTSMTSTSGASSDTANSPSQSYAGNRGGQNGGPNNAEREQRRQQRMQQMATELGLTDAQKQQMEDIRKTIPDRAQRHAAIMAILTPDQQAKMEQMRAQRGNRGGGGGGNGPGGQPPPTK